MRRVFLGIALLSIVAALAYWGSHRNRAPLETVYAINRKVTVWSSNAQVREPVETLNFGDRLEIINRSGDNADVRTATGVEGWIAAREAVSSDIWKRMTLLSTQARTMPIQARAHTKVLSASLRLDPGRNGALIFQVGRDTKIAILARRVLDVVKPAAAPNESNSDSPDDDADSQEPPTTKKEDWLLVLADVKDAGAIAGWVLARFTQMDLPSPLPDYAISAGMRVSAWFQLNSVNDASGASKPQYLLFGSRGPEGDICDFTTMRAYTWGAKRARYETAFVESAFCGLMPVLVTPATQPGGDATFRFEAASDSGKEERVYRMHQTIIRRIDSGNAERHAKRRPRGH
ncbi:MAG: SH3 domain-containing protein [Candidatus Acidiferrales bacterium]